MRKLIKFVREYWSLIVGVTILVVMLSSCKGTKVIPVVHDTTYVSKIEYKDRLIHDSVYTDKYHTIFQKGDTIFIHDSVWNGQWKVAHDSVYVHDTLYKSKDKPVMVENEKKVYVIWPSVLIIGVFVFSAIYAYLRRKWL